MGSGADMLVGDTEEMTAAKRTLRRAISTTTALIAKLEGNKVEIVTGRLVSALVKALSTNE